MKRLLSGFCALLITLSVATYSAPSKAAVGITQLNAGVVLGGLAMTTAGVLIRKTPGFVGLLGYLGAIIGLVVLDGEQGQEVEFSALSLEEAKSLEITVAEMESFNAEIDQVNILFSEVALQLEGIEKPTTTDAKAAWDGLEGLVAQETFSAMKKISVKSVR